METDEMEMETIKQNAPNMPGRKFEDSKKTNKKRASTEWQWRHLRSLGWVSNVFL
jgi:hypothetical protein